MKSFSNWLLILVLCVSGFHVVKAQKPQEWNSASLYQAIQKLNFLGSALYVAAHPDDENQRMIAYLSNEVKANTAYLSLTRGDGGQNLIGPEIRELLGVIRTQELLAARRIDGGTQLFSRANDFGYSKHPDETLKIWNKEEVLSDVVWAIRKWQPDIIINRFDHRTPGRTHGHHTSSAMLSVEAFDLTGDEGVYPDQLKYVKPWQPSRIFFNTSWWFYGSQENFEKADKSKMMSVDIGVFYPLLGKSNTEIAAAARSMHKCQGFGSMGSRGSMSEYLELIKGEMPDDKENLFDGINTNWTRVKGGAPIGKILSAVEKDYRFEDPAASVPALMKAYKLINNLPEGYWKWVKLKEIRAVIQGCLGLFTEAVAGDFSATPDEEIELAIEVINRSKIPVSLKTVTYLPERIDTALQLDLDNNQSYRFFKKLEVPSSIGFSNPYWLNEKSELGMYTVESQLLRGVPETPRPIKVAFEYTVDGISFELVKDVIFKRSDPVDGEVYRPFEITPPVFANIKDKVFVFGDNQSKTVEILVKSGKPNVSGVLTFTCPKGWQIEPEFVEFDLKLKGEEKTIRFSLTPPVEQSEGYILPILRVNGETYHKGLAEIEYDHIPTQMVFQDNLSKVVRIDLEKIGNKIGYIMGAGDAVPESLEQIGYEVTVLEDGDISVENLNTFDAIILGVRAYNTQERLKFHQPKLLSYVEQGGTMIVQYNTAHRLKLSKEAIAPYPLKLSRDRVSMEEAGVRFLLPDHPVLNFPNKITSKDFDGWVQERGLYFPNEWSKEYSAILSSNDPGEPARDGGLLVAKHGKGYYIYTGYSWFRELPAGVPGAFRIFANLISIGKEQKR